jgi:DNA-binding NtrC family response regulator
VLVLRQYGTIDSAIQAARIGARDYVTKPFRIEELRTGSTAPSRPSIRSRKIACCANG